MTDKANCKGGRPTSVTAEAAAAFLAELEGGLPLESAARAAGTSLSAVKRRRKADPGFAAAMGQAVAKGESALAARVRGADDWRAAAWMLERRFRENWARRVYDPSDEEIDREIRKLEGVARRQARTEALAEFRAGTDATGA